MDEPLNAGSLEGDPKFLLGQIAALLRALPARMDKLEKSHSDALHELTETVKQNSEALNKRIDAVDNKVDNVEKKQHFIAGAWAAIAAALTAIGIYLKGHA